MRRTRLVRQTTRLAGAALCAALTLSTLPAFAWEVVGGSGLPTFAAGFGPSGSTPASSPGPTAAVPALGVTPAGVGGFNPGYDFRIGQKYLLGVETKTGIEATGGLLGFASGFDASRTTMKFGYDMGSFKPFVMSSFTEVRPAFGMNAFSTTAAVPSGGSPFAPSTRTSTVGAGFDYAVTDKLSFGVTVSASQATTGWQR